MKNNRTRKTSAQKKRCSNENAHSPATYGNFLGHISFRQGQSIAVSMNNFKDTLNVDIRKWEWIDGKLIPTKNGIRFPADRIEEIEKHLKKAKQIRDA